MAKQDFIALQRKVEELIKLSHALNEENRSLKAREAHLQQERNRLGEKYELARSRLEAMVTRLKALEQAP